MNTQRDYRGSAVLRARWLAGRLTWSGPGVKSAQRLIFPFVERSHCNTFKFGFEARFFFPSNALRHSSPEYAGSRQSRLLTAMPKAADQLQRAREKSGHEVTSLWAVQCEGHADFRPSSRSDKLPGVDFKVAMELWREALARGESLRAYGRYSLLIWFFTG